MKIVKAVVVDLCDDPKKIIWRVLACVEEKGQQRKINEFLKSEEYIHARSEAAKMLGCNENEIM